MIEAIIIKSNTYNINLNHVLYWRQNKIGNLVFRMSNDKWVVTTCPYDPGNSQLLHDLAGGYNPIELYYESLPTKLPRRK